MATTTADMGQLTKEELLNSAIRYHQERLWRARLADGADITLSKDDMPPAIITAIHFFNTGAFKELLKKLVEMKANLNEVADGQIEPPLFIAAARGDLYMVEALLAAGANPHQFNQATVLTSTLEHVSSRALVEPRWSRWRYEHEPRKANNAALAKQMSDFFWQQGDYTPLKANQVIPFPAPPHTIHVHFKGKLSILSTFFANNINVSPLIPLEGSERSPLKLVQHPSNYASIIEGNPDEALKYIGTEPGKPHILLFEMTFANKRLTGTTPTRIIVHYNFKYARRLIETVLRNQHGHAHAATMASLASKLEEGMREKGNKLDTQLSNAKDELKEKLEAAQAETARLQAELAKAQNQTADLAKTVEGVDQAVKKVDAAVHDVDAATKKVDQAVQDVRAATHADELAEVERFKAFIERYPNAKEVYNTILSRLKSIHKSAQAVDGGGVVVSEGSLGVVARVLDVGTEVVESIPLVGAAASKLFGLAASATRQVDGIRQTNIYENIAAMVPATGAGKIFESVARKLTLAYLPHFERLLSREEAEAQTSRVTGTVKNALKSRFKSPAERVAAFAIILMIESVFNNMHALRNELEKPNGLETLLLNTVIQHKPEQGIAPFWNTITAKLGIDQIPIRAQSGMSSTETWPLAHLWTMPADLAALGLMPPTETALLPQASSPTATSASSATAPSANSRPTVPVPPPPSPRMMYAYGNPSASAPPRKPEPYEIKSDKQEPPTPPVSKRSKSKSPSPFSRLRLPGFRERTTS